MNIVEIGNRKYIVGVKWYVFDDEQEVKDKVKDLKKDKKKWRIFKTEDLIFLAVADQDLKKYDLLAYKILDVGPGVYTVKFDNDNCWIFVKGTDGGILFDEYGNCQEINTKNESELYDYKASLSSFEYTKEQLEKILSEKVGKTKDINVDKKLVFIGIGGFVFVIAGIFGIKHILSARKPLPPKVVVKPTPATKKPFKPKVEATQSIGQIDIRDCYDKWFATVLYNSKYKQTCNTINQKTITEKDISSLNLPNCVKTAKFIYKFALYGGMNLSWGQVGYFGNAKILNFKIFGTMYKPMAEEFAKYYFTLPVQTQLYGSPSAPTFILQGGILCE